MLAQLLLNEQVDLQRKMKNHKALRPRLDCYTVAQKTGGLRLTKLTSLNGRSGEMRCTAISL